MRIGSERFAVERVVGTGAMGTVFFARERQTGEPVAFKVLRGPAPEARFDREVEILAQLRHPRIVGYLGHGVTDHGEPFLAMEWIDGETLRARLARGGLGVAETVRMGAALADGLAAAHRAGIVHRDVKPANLLLPAQRSEQVKLADFGVARLADVPGQLTRSGDVVGTPLYMAPEQLLRPSPACDVFSLGAVLHECLTGQLPAARPALRVLRPELPAAVASVIEGFLARDPAERPADGAAAHASLTRLLGDGEELGPPRKSRAASFERLKTDDASGPHASRLAVATIALLGRHLAMPRALLVSQCEKHRVDAEALTARDLTAIAPALAEAVGRFTAPGTAAVVLAELVALAGDTLGDTPC